MHLLTTQTGDNYCSRQQILVKQAVEMRLGFGLYSQAEHGDSEPISWAKSFYLPSYTVELIGLRQGTHQHSVFAIVH